MCIIYNIFLLCCMFCIFITCSTSYFHIDQLTNLQNCMYAHLYTCVKFTNLNTYVCEWKIFFTEDFPLAVCKHEYEVSFVSHGSYSPVHFSNGSLNSCKWNLCTYTHSIVVLTYKFHIMDTRDMKLLSLEFTCTHFYPQMEKFCVQCQDCIFIPPPPFILNILLCFTNYRIIANLPSKQLILMLLYYTGMQLHVSTSYVVILRSFILIKLDNQNYCYVHWRFRLRYRSLVLYNECQ